MFHDVNIDSNMLDANGNYFVTTYIINFNSLENMSASDANAQMNKSENADVDEFPLWFLCVIGIFQQGIYIEQFEKIQEEVKNIDIKQSNKRNKQNSKSKRHDCHMKSGDTVDRRVLICMKTRVDIRCSGRVSISYSACGTRHDVPYVVSRNETHS